MKLIIVPILLFGAAGSPALPPSSSIQAAVDSLYDSRFDAGREVLQQYSADHPRDPLPYALKAASYLFAELERGGVLKSGFLSDDKRVREGSAYRPDAEAVAKLDEAVAETRTHALAQLALSPEDRNALLAMCIVAGVQRDYLALVVHKMRESYTYIRESQAYAKRLLKVDPTAYDAYLTKGFTEYLVASLPFYLRWPMSLDDVSGTKEQGLSDLQIAAQSGQYLKPFAQLLLAMFYLREKQDAKTGELLAQLTGQYPRNKTFRAEREKFCSAHGTRHLSSCMWAY